MRSSHRRTKALFVYSSLLLFSVSVSLLDIILLKVLSHIATANIFYNVQTHRNANVVLKFTTILSIAVPERFHAHSHPFFLPMWTDPCNHWWLIDSLFSATFFKSFALCSHLFFTRLGLTFCKVWRKKVNRADWLPNKTLSLRNFHHNCKSVGFFCF